MAVITASAVTVATVTTMATPIRVLPAVIGSIRVTPPVFASRSVLVSPLVITPVTVILTKNSTGENQNEHESK